MSTFIDKTMARMAEQDPRVNEPGARVQLTVVEFRRVLEKAYEVGVRHGRASVEPKSPPSSSSVIDDFFGLFGNMR